MSITRVYKQWEASVDHPGLANVGMLEDSTCRHLPDSHLLMRTSKRVYGVGFYVGLRDRRRMSKMIRRDVLSERGRRKLGVVAQGSESLGLSCSACQSQSRGGLHRVGIVVQAICRDYLFWVCVGRTAKVGGWGGITETEDMMFPSQCIQTPQHHVTIRPNRILIDGFVPTWCNCNVGAPPLSEGLF